MVGTDAARPEANACVLDRSVWGDQTRSAKARIGHFLQQPLHVGEGGFSQQDSIVEQEIIGVGISADCRVAGFGE